MLAASLTAHAEERIELRFDVSQAEAVLQILETRAARQVPSDSSWQRLFDSEPYRRLKQRDAQFGRELDDAGFRAFVVSAELVARRYLLRQTLSAWRSADLDAAAQRVLDYLPATARIRAKVFPVIKPQSNSFVFELRTDATIFLYLDPEQSPAKFANTVAHELHHIGLATVFDGRLTEERAIGERPCSSSAYKGPGTR